MDTLTLESQVKALESELIRLQEAAQMDDYYWDLEDEFFRLRKLLEESKPKKITLINYTEDSQYINSSIRQTGEIPACLIEELSELTTSDIGLWRGLKHRHLINETANGVWTPKGLISTSISLEVGLEFSSPNGKYGSYSSNLDYALVYIYDQGSQLKTSYHADEKEVLLHSKQYCLFNVDVYLDRHLYIAIPIGSSVNYKLVYEELVKPYLI